MSSQTLSNRRSVAGSRLLTTVLVGVLALTLSGCSSRNPKKAAADQAVPGNAPSEKAQHHIDRGRFLLHCFEHQLARYEFLQAIEIDSEAAMAHGGLALSYHHPFSLPATPATLKLSSDAMQRALTAEHANVVDRKFIKAASKLFLNVDNTSLEQRNQDHHAALSALYAEYPDDIEVAAALALSHLAVRKRPLTRDFTHEHMVEKILWPHREQHLDHVGLLHYLILALDGTPEDARRALPAATLMGNLTSAVPLTRRAPARLFFRLGMWPDAVHTTRAADESAKALLATMEWPRERRDFESAVFRMHALVNAGRPGEAKTLLGELRIIAFETRHPAAMSAAFRARHIYLLEGRRWTEGIEEKLDIGEEAETIMLAHAASVAGGFLGVPFVCGHALEYYKKRLDTVDPVQILEVDSTLALINRDFERVHTQMQKAVLLESSRGTRSVIPSPPLPACELYGELLLKMKLPEQAVQQFEQALEDRMNRPMALLGLARARVQLGQKEDAIEPLEKLLKIWSLAEADFAPLQSAKQLLHEARRPVAEAAQQSLD